MMARWWKSSQMLKTNLAAGGVIALLFLSACGEEEAKQDAATDNATVETVTIDPAQAPVIQKGVEEYLAQMEGPESQRVLHHSAVKVTPGSNAFDVAIEGIQIGPKGDDHLEVGTITYRLTPKGTEGYIASDLTHAAMFPFRTADGKQAGSLALTTKSFTGEWSSDLQSFLALNWQATDLIAKDDTENGGDVRASSLSANLSSTDKGNGLFDQKGLFNIAGFSAKDTTGGSFGLGKVAGEFGVNAFKLKEYVIKAREIQALTAEIAATSAANEASATGESAPESTLSPEQAQKMGEAIKSMSSLIGGVTYGFDFEDVTYKEADGTQPFSLKSGNFDLGFAGLDTEKATVTFGIGHDGLAINDPELTAIPLFAKLMPAQGSLGLTLSDVPSKELWKLVGDQFPTLVAGDQGQAEAAMNVMIVAMSQLLQQAPMKLSVAPSGLSAEIMQVGASGAFDVHPDAMFGLIGALDVDVHGLDAAMQLATEAAQNSPEAAQVVGSLAMIQSLAKRETSSDGKPVDKLKIEVDAMGDTKVNGVSLSGM
jgi:hypothetical protein